MKKALQQCRRDLSRRAGRSAIKLNFRPEKKKKEESWADFADSLRTLVDKASRFGG